MSCRRPEAKDRLRRKADSGPLHREQHLVAFEVSREASVWLYKAGEPSIAAREERPES